MLFIKGKSGAGKTAFCKNFFPDSLF